LSVCPLATVAPAFAVINPDADIVVNAPVDATVDPIGPGLANVAPFKDDAFKFGIFVVEETTKGGVPVVTVDVSWPVTDKDVPVAAPMFGVVSVGEVCKTTDPDPVAVVEPVPPFKIGSAVPENETAKVPEVVTGDPLTDKNDGTVKATEVTVPEPADDQVIGFDPPPPEVKTWPAVPALVGKLKLYVPATAWGKILITPLVLPVNVWEAEFTFPLTDNDVPVAAPMLGVVNEGDVCKTNAPDPVELATEIANVPLEVIGEPETDKNEGTVNATEVTVPVVGVVHVITFDPPPPDVRTWPDVPAVIGILKL
jgi:hypothetical protein